MNTFGFYEVLPLESQWNCDQNSNWRIRLSIVDFETIILFNCMKLRDVKRYEILEGQVVMWGIIWPPWLYRDSSSQDFEFHMYNDFELECSWCCAIYYYSLTQTSILWNGNCASGYRALKVSSNLEKFNFFKVCEW